MRNSINAKHCRTHPLTVFFIVFFIATFLLLSGCASKRELQDTIKARDSLANNNKLLRNQIAEIESQKKSLGSKLSKTSGELTLKERELLAKSDALEKSNITLSLQNKELEATIRELNTKSAELKVASDTLNKNRELYDGLVADLEGELSENQVKIKEMKDGISLNLAQEILFDSGSANLNKSGKAVITKVAGQLKDIEYNTIVAGFTDNVPIRNALATKYPTNWELAGARAASVVKLLESNGVKSDKLRAVSYGKNQPVASNDTAEGKALNRRIEILLKPVE